MAGSWSVQGALDWGRGRIGAGWESRLEAEILLANALGRSREWLIAHGDEHLEAPAYHGYSRMVELRASTGVPIAYLVGHREFAGLDFIVRPGVLVPRPETETLVDAVRAWLAADGLRFPGGILVDAGCGSGIVAVSLAKYTGRKVLATDVSPLALVITSENAVRHGVDGLVEVLKGSWLEPVGGNPRFQGVCAIASNPPYIPSGVLGTLARDVRDFEPHLALDGGRDGMDAIRKVIQEAEVLLPPGGLLAMETGSDQAGEVEALLGAGGWSGTAVIPDLAGLSRVVTAEKGAK